MTSHGKKQPVASCCDYQVGRPGGMWERKGIWISAKQLEKSPVILWVKLVTQSQPVLAYDCLARWMTTRTDWLPEQLPPVGHSCTWYICLSARIKPDWASLSAHYGPQAASSPPTVFVTFHWKNHAIHLHVHGYVGITRAELGIYNRDQPTS